MCKYNFSIHVTCVGDMGVVPELGAPGIFWVVVPHLGQFATVKRELTFLRVFSLGESFRDFVAMESSFQETLKETKYFPTYTWTKHTCGQLKSKTRWIPGWLPGGHSINLPRSCSSGCFSCKGRARGRIPQPGRMNGYIIYIHAPEN